MFYITQYFSTIIMGIVQGITEFIPVSSTGHLILATEVLDFKVDENHFFEVFIQLGSILAVVFLYWKRFIGLLDFKRHESSTSFCGINGIVKLAIACIPACIVGALFHKYVKTVLYSPLPVASALIFGAILMMIVEKFIATQKPCFCGLHKPQQITNLEGISHKQALIVGLFQCLALWPGMSRSGSTIIGGMFSGISRTTAAEFSFLIAVPMMCAATAYDCIKSWSGLDISMLPIFIVGFIISFIVSIVAIKFMLAILNKYSLLPFAYYRVVLGILVILTCWDL